MTLLLTESRSHHESSVSDAAVILKLQLSCNFVCVCEITMVMVTAREQLCPLYGSIYKHRFCNQHRASVKSLRTILFWLGEAQPISNPSPSQVHLSHPLSSWGLGFKALPP